MRKNTTLHALGIFLSCCVALFRITMINNHGSVVLTVSQRSQWLAVQTATIHSDCITS